MPHLKFNGKVLKQYHGIDKDTVVVAGVGDVIHVSEEKANRLLKDFPMEFQIHNTKSDDDPKKVKEVDELDDDPIPQQEDEKPEVEKLSKNKMVTKARKKKRK